MKYIITILVVCFSLIGMAQEIEMADQMRSSGKIYVVVAVLSIILIGLFTYLILIDRKISRIEKDMKKG